VRGQLVADAARRSRPEVLAAQPVAQAASDDPEGRTARGQQRDEAAELTADRDRRITPAREQDARGTREHLELHAGERVRRQQQQIPEQMIEPVSPTVDHHDPPCATRDGRMQRELEIGRVLLGRIAVHGRP
jgi:hypothetical protein